MEQNRPSPDREGGYTPIPADALALVDELAALLNAKQLGKAQRLYFQRMPGLSAYGKRAVDAVMRQRLEIDFLPDEIRAILEGTRNVLNKDTGYEIDPDRKGPEAFDD